MSRRGLDCARGTDLDRLEFLGSTREWVAIAGIASGYCESPVSLIGMGGMRDSKRMRFDATRRDVKC